jgi:hypothetical protein
MPITISGYDFDRRAAPGRNPESAGPNGPAAPNPDTPSRTARRMTLAAAMLGAGFLVVVSGESAETAMLPETDLFPGAEIVTEAQLSDLRGGFSVPSMPGLSFNFGINVYTTFTAPELPDSPTVTVETNLYFDSSSDVQVSSQTNYTTTQGTTTTYSTDLTSINLTNSSFSTTNIVSIQGQNIVVDSSSSTSGATNSLSPPNADGNLVLVNSFSSSLIASIISNTLSQINVSQTTSIDVDVQGHANFVKSLPNAATLDALRSLNHSVLMSLSN